MPLLPLYGHTALRERLRDMAQRGTLPSSLLIQGPRGIGKQQIALWLGRLLVCENPAKAPCEACRACRMTAELQHPDLHWFFPRERLKRNPDDIEEIREDMADAVRERMENGGLYEASSGAEGIFVATIRALVQTASMKPAMGHRKVLIVADAEQMVVQEGADQAANAFLKLLEEPLADTTIILTSSEAGGLLPTVRSRVVAFRAAPLGDEDMKAFLANPTVAQRLDLGARSSRELLELVAGSPGRLVSLAPWEAAMTAAGRIVEAATTPDRGPRMRVALGQGGAGARGKFSDTLEALSVVLHRRARDAAASGNDLVADGAARAMAVVEEAKEHAYHNVNPQLITASILRQISRYVR